VRHEWNTAPVITEAWHAALVISRVISAKLNKIKVLIDNICILAANGRQERKGVNMLTR